MKLLRCHIDNFGKLEDYTVNFTENPQVFYEPNGWGKSTLAAFIKVMFYGFANEGKRGATLEKERVRYKPWQGGVYGGEILFEVGGKQYLLNRTFGSKEAEDTFALYDGVTNLPSGDYTTNIGEELFQINQESFLRTVFLAQSDCDTFATDSINAKIGNLADNLDDINNYEKVQQVLKDLRNSMSPTRKTGSLKKQKEVIAELKDELRRASATEAAVAELEGKVLECGEEQKRLIKERKDAQTQWEALAGKKALEAKKTHYESIISSLQEKQRLADERLAVMGGKLPDKEKLSAMQGQYRRLQEQESEASANCLQESEGAELVRLRERFAKGVPEAEMLKECREQLNHLEKLRLEAARRVLDEHELSDKKHLEEQLGLADGSTEEGQEYLEELEGSLDESLHRVSVYIEQKNGLSAKKATLSSLRMLREQQNAQKKQQMDQRVQQLQERQYVQRKAQIATVLVLIVGLVLLVAGGGLLVLANKVAGIIMLCAGAVAAVPGVVMLIIGRNRQAALQDEISAAKVEGTEADTTESDGSVSALEQEIAKDEEGMAANRSFVAAVLADVADDEDWNADSIWENPLRLRDKLYGRKDDVKSLLRLMCKEQDYQAKGYETQIKELQEQIAAVLKPYSEAIDEGRLGQLLTSLSEEKEQFVVLDAREKKYKVAHAEAERSRQCVTEFLEKHGQGTGDLYESLQNLTSNLKEYETVCTELDKLKAEKQKFEAENDITAFEAITDSVELSEEALKARMEELDKNIASIGEQIHGYRRQLEDRQAELEELSLQREQLSLAEAEYEKDNTYYTRIGYVSEYLEKAKESLSAKYIGPVLDSFKRNYELLAGESGEDFRMDANIQVTKRALGQQRETGAFSAGNKDLINIVLRIALVEAMYQKEKPFLVIDDSFVNLDGKRLETAGNFLKQIAKDYQVIYFTCHESRVLE